MASVSLVRRQAQCRVLQHCRLVQHCSKRCLQTSSVYQKNIRSAVPKSNLHEEEGASDAAMEDEMIRKLMSGIWGRKLLSECIIKRRFNTVTLVFLANQFGKVGDLSFLIGFTEELLSHLLKRPVNIEMQTVAENPDSCFRRV